MIKMYFSKVALALKQAVKIVVANHVHGSCVSLFFWVKPALKIPHAISVTTKGDKEWLS